MVRRPPGRLFSELEPLEPQPASGPGDQVAVSRAGPVDPAAVHLRAVRGAEVDDRVLPPSSVRARRDGARRSDRRWWMSQSLERPSVTIAPRRARAARRPRRARLGPAASSTRAARPRPRPADRGSAAAPATAPPARRHRPPVHRGLRRCPRRRLGRRCRWRRRQLVGPGTAGRPRRAAARAAAGRRLHRRARSRTRRRRDRRPRGLSTRPRDERIALAPGVLGEVVGELLSSHARSPELLAILRREIQAGTRSGRRRARRDIVRWSSISLASLRASSTGWTCERKARPKTPSKRDSMRARCFAATLMLRD